MESLDKQLRFAIENKRLITVSYHRRPRVVEPHDYGVLNGAEKLLVFQLRGGSHSAPRDGTGWRLLELSKIEECSVLAEIFPGSRGRAYRNHLKWEVLYARVG